MESVLFPLLQQLFQIIDFEILRIILHSEGVRFRDRDLEDISDGDGDVRGDARVDVSAVQGIETAAAGGDLEAV